MDVEYQIVESSLSDDLKQVDLVLYWTDEKGSAHEKLLTTKFLKQR